MVKTLGPTAGSTKPHTVKPNYNMQFFRFLVYGHIGVGKTYLMGSICDVPELCPILYLDSDMGTMTISDRDIEVVPIKCAKDIEDVNKYVRAHPGEYKTVVLDGLTACYNQMIRLRMLAPGRTSNEDPYVPSQRDWMHGTFRMRLVLDMLKTAPVNFIATAMVDIRANEITQAPMIRPGLSNKLAGEVGALFDIVGYLTVKIQIKEKTRLLQLDPFGGRAAKNRAIYPLPAVLERPHMHILYGRAVLGRPLETLQKEAAELERKHQAHIQYLITKE